MLTMVPSGYLGYGYKILLLLCFSEIVRFLFFFFNNKRYVLFLKSGGEKKFHDHLYREVSSPEVSSPEVSEEAQAGLEGWECSSEGCVRLVATPRGQSGHSPASERKFLNKT